MPCGLRIFLTHATTYKVEVGGMFIRKITPYFNCFRSSNQYNKAGNSSLFEKRQSDH